MISDSDDWAPRSADYYLRGSDRLTDDELANFDTEAAFTNADLSWPGADAADLRAVTAASEALGAAVSAARARGRSWSRIGGLLGLTGEEARQRFEAGSATCRHHGSLPAPSYLEQEK